MNLRMASTIEPSVSPVISAVAGASPYPMFPVSVSMMTTMSSTVSTVRSAVLKGIFNGTRSMPKRTAVIFMLEYSRLRGNSARINY